MTFDARARLAPACHRTGCPYSPITAADRVHRTVGPVGPTVHVVLINGWLDHRVSLAVTKLPGSRWKG